VQSNVDTVKVFIQAVSTVVLGLLAL